MEQDGADRQALIDGAEYGFTEHVNDAGRMSQIYRVRYDSCFQFPGDRRSAPHLRRRHQPACLAEHEVYDTATSTWTAAPPLPTPRHGRTAAVLGGCIYVIGGGPRAGLAQTEIVEIYTP